MKRWGVLPLLAVALVLGACGGDDGGAGEVETAGEAQPRDPGPTRTPQRALRAIEDQAARAAGNLGGIEDTDLLPSEDGAELLITRGYIDADEFCAADETATRAEAGPEAEDAFEAGWRQSAPEAVDDMGATIYNALSFGCLDL